MSFTTPTVDVYVPGTTLGIGNVNAGTINIGKAGTTINVGGSMAVTNSVTTPSCTMTSLTTGNLIISPFSGDVAFNNFSAVNATIGNASMINASFNSINSSNILIGPYPVSGMFTNLAVTNASINNVSSTNLTSVNISANTFNVSNLLITPLSNNVSFVNISCITGNFSSIYSAGFYSTSDYKLKENIQYIHDNYEITKLKPCTFNFINTSTKKIGFIAQDVQEIIPESVISSGDNLNIDYSALISVSIFSIQNILKTTEILTNKIEKIERNHQDVIKENENLKTIIDEIKNRLDLSGL